MVKKSNGISVNTIQSAVIIFEVDGENKCHTSLSHVQPPQFCCAPSHKRSGADTIYELVPVTLRPNPEKKSIFRNVSFVCLTLVSYQIRFCDKFLAAQNALVTFNNFPTCNPASLKIGFCKKSLIANRTWKRLLFQMSKSVVVVMVLVHEAFATYLTYKMESLLMAFHMQLIIISRGELFTTVFLLTDDINFSLEKN